MNIRGERILILGDSLSSMPPYPTDRATVVDLATGPSTVSPGGLLGRHLLAAHAQAVRVNARIGRSAISFINGEKGLSLIANDVSQFRPTKVIVFLGTNDIDRGLTPDALARTSTAMAAIRDAFKNAEVIALGPPSYPNPKYASGAPLMLKTIQSVFGADRTLDIQPFTAASQRTKDGIHFTAAGAQDAAPEIAAAIATLGQPMTPAPSATSMKIAWGVAGVAGFVGATLLALYIAKRAAQNPRGFAFSVGRTALRYALKRR
jgi:lysophospholipase L1-like esterase